MDSRIRQTKNCREGDSCGLMPHSYSYKRSPNLRLKTDTIWFYRAIIAYFLVSNCKKLSTCSLSLFSSSVCMMGCMGLLLLSSYKRYKTKERMFGLLKDICFNSSQSMIQKSHTNISSSIFKKQTPSSAILNVFPCRLIRRIYFQRFFIV